MGLLKPGPFLGGLVLALLGIAVFIFIPQMPVANTPEGTVANARLLGQIGGGMIGLGLVLAVIGLVRRR